MTSGGTVFWSVKSKCKKPDGGGGGGVAFVIRTSVVDNVEQPRSINDLNKEIFVFFP